MTITLYNDTGEQLAYLGSQVSLPASGSVAIASGLAPYLAVDSAFASDISSGNVHIGDGAYIYSGNAALGFLNDTFITGTPPQNESDLINFTLGGYGFSISASANITTSETNLLLVTNPSASGKNARATFFYVGTDGNQGCITARCYSSSTVTANGTDISANILNCFDGGPNPSAVTKVYSGPSTSSRGVSRLSLTSWAGSTAPLHPISQSAILAPNKSLLITAQSSNIGLALNIQGHFFLQWVEV
jgi:hypothetical protein